MQYNSLAFYAFFVLLLVVYFIIPAKYRWELLLIFSLGFYLASGVGAFLIVLGTSLIVYIAGRKMGSIYLGYDKDIKEKGLSKKEKYGSVKNI